MAQSEEERGALPLTFILLHLTSLSLLDLPPASSGQLQQAPLRPLLLALVSFSLFQSLSSFLADFLSLESLSLFLSHLARFTARAQSMAMVARQQTRAGEWDSESAD